MTRRFLEAMSSKAPKIIFTDQDVAMAKAIPIVMPNTKHRLCTWHLMQNALRHANSIFKDKAVKDKGMKSVLSTFMYDIEDEEEFTLKWEEMLDKYEVRDNQLTTCNDFLTKKSLFPNMAHNFTIMACTLCVTTQTRPYGFSTVTGQ